MYTSNMPSAGKPPGKGLQRLNVPFFAATFQLQKYNLFHYHQIYFCFFSFTYLLSYQRHNERSTKPCFFVTNRNDR